MMEKEKQSHDLRRTLLSSKPTRITFSAEENDRASQLKKSKKESKAEEKKWTSEYRKSRKEFNAKFGKEELEAESSAVDLLKYERRDVKGDAMNFILLTFLYFIQGAVAGLMMAVPLILQKRDATYQQQATFHLSTYAMSFKILWSPFLDSFFMKGEGRRKSVAITMQYFIGGFLLLVSYKIDSFLGTDDNVIKPNIMALTVVFFLCNLFSSIQDAALDGWSLTIFQKKNKVYSASCRGLGVSLGRLLILPGFINLESTYFANRFRQVRGETGFVDFEGFTRFLAVVFIVTTSLILKFKKEKRDEDIELDLTKADKDRNQNMKETYSHILKILRFGPIQTMVLFLLTWHMSFGPITHAAPLKLLDYGVPRGNISILIVCGIPLQMLLPILLNRYVTRPQPVRIFIVAFIARLANGLVLVPVLYGIILRGKDATKNDYWFYIPLFLIFSLDHVAVFAMIMAIVALFTRISHHEYGNAFMTLVISLNNFGGSWPSTVCLWLLDLLPNVLACELKAKTLYFLIDGYCVEVAVCILIGSIWICWAKKKITQLEKYEVALVHDSEC